MKKNIVKFIIIFSLIFNFSTPKVFSQNLDSLGRLINILGQTSNKFSGEKLEKLLLENHIIIYDYYGPLRNEIELNFNADKSYKLNGIFPHGGRAIHPSSGTWELVGLGNSYVRFNDNQNISYSNNKARFQFLFGEDGNIYEGSEKIYSFRLENKKERINRQAQVAEEKRIAEELRLKKIEEEKRQLAIKREQERIKAEQIKKEEEKKRLELAEWAKKEEEEKIKRENEERIKSEREKFFKNILKYSLITVFFSILSFVIYKYRARIKDEFYPKFIKYLKNIKSNKKEFYPKLIGYIKDIQTNSDKKLGFTLMGVFFVVIVLIVISLSENKSSTSNQNYSTSNEISDEKFRRYVELRTAIKRECDNKWYTRGLSTIAADVEKMCRNNMYDVRSKTFIGETSEVKRRLRDYGVYE